MLPGANAEAAQPWATPAEIRQPVPPAWLGAHWIETAAREPQHLDELGTPLRCFHLERGYYLACYLPERGWYWAADAIPVRPDRWAAPAPRGGRRFLPH